MKRSAFGFGVRTMDAVRQTGCLPLTLLRRKSRLWAALLRQGFAAAAPKLEERRRGFRPTGVRKVPRAGPWGSTDAVQPDTALTVHVSTALKEIEEREWNAIFPHTPEGYHFFRVIEATLSRQFTFYYISIYRGSRIVCLAPCFLTEYSLDATVDGPLKTLAIWVKRASPRLLTTRILVCGSPTGEGRLGIVTADLPRTAPLLVEAMRALARRAGAQLLAFKDFSPSYASFFEALSKMKFHHMPSYPSAELEITFPSFEAYLASLSKATRKDLRRKFKKSDTLHVDMQVRSDLGDLLDQAYQLYLNTFERSEIKFELITKEFFEQISRALPAETRYFLWRIDGRLVAVDLCLVSGSTLVDEYLGMDYDVAYKYHLYYLTFRDILTWCIQHGIRRYSGGTINYDPKKRLDFTFVPQTIAFKHTNRLMNLVFGLIGLLVNPENFDPLLKSLNQRSLHDANR